jgi:hypothetical protein
LVIEAKGGLVRVYLAQPGKGKLKAIVREIWDYLNSHDRVIPVEEPFRVYWTCYQGLVKMSDPRADKLLEKAFVWLQEQAARLPDEESRQIFLERIPYHREIVSAYQLVGVEFP